MSRVIAFLDDSPVAALVQTTANTIARLLGATVDAVRMVDPAIGADRTPRSGARSVVGSPETDLASELEAGDVDFGVVGSRAIESKPAAIGHIAESLIVGSAAPLVVVPPGGRPLAGDDLVFLLPLDGRPETTTAATPIVSSLTARLGDVITMHVFDSSTIPMFIASTHDQEVIAKEFLATHALDSSTKMHLRLGQPAAEILDVAQREDVDAIILAWNQDLRPGRAQVIQRLLRESPIPIVLQPIRDRHT